MDPVINKRSLISQQSKSGMASSKGMTLDKQKTQDKPTTARVALKKTNNYLGKSRRDESPDRKPKMVTQHMTLNSTMNSAQIGNGLANDKSGQQFLDMSKMGITSTSLVDNQGPIKAFESGAQSSVYMNILANNKDVISPLGTRKEKGKLHQKKTSTISTKIRKSEGVH
jgi:hypothetical protein